MHVLILAFLAILAIILIFRRENQLIDIKKSLAEKSAAICLKLETEFTGLRSVITKGNKDICRQLGDVKQQLSEVEKNILAVFGERYENICGAIQAIHKSIRINETHRTTETEIFNDKLKVLGEEVRDMANSCSIGFNKLVTIGTDIIKGNDADRETDAKRDKIWKSAFDDLSMLHEPIGTLFTKLEEVCRDIANLKQTQRAFDKSSSDFFANGKTALIGLAEQAKVAEAKVETFLALVTSLKKTFDLFLVNALVDDIDRSLNGQNRSKTTGVDAEVRSGNTISMAKGGKKASPKTNHATAQSAINVSHAVNKSDTPEIGTVFEGTITLIRPHYGLSVEIMPGVVGFCHISELSDKHISKISDADYKIGDKILVKCIGTDGQKGFWLSHKDAIGNSDSAASREAKARLVLALKQRSRQ